MAQVDEHGNAMPRPGLRSRRTVPARTGRRPGSRLARASAVSAFAGLLSVWLPPALAPAAACGSADADTTVITAGSLADDGELEAVEQRFVRGDGEVCVTEADAVEPTVAVGIVHTDAEGRSREAAELDRVEGRLTTRIEARDVTAATREVTVVGPLGADTVERRLGMPQLVRIAVAYPSGWDVEAPGGDGITTTVQDGVVEVSRSVVLFPPLLDDTVALQVGATPARGTPSVTVEASPLAGDEPLSLPAGVLEQDALAVTGALSALGEDGASQLADGAGELAEGVGEVAGGATELADGTRDLAGGVAGLAGGTGELAGGAGEVAGGAAELADGSRQLAGGVEETARGSGELAAGARQLEGGGAELSAAAGELADGADELAAGAQALADGLAVGGEVPTPELDIDALTTGLEKLADEIVAVRDDLAAKVQPGPDPDVEVDVDPDVDADVDPDVEVEVDADVEVDAGVGAVPGADDPLVTAVATLTALSDATIDLADQLRTGLDGIGAAFEGLEEAAAGAAGLAAGAGELAAGGAALAAGVDELAAGASELAAGSTELTTGLEQLAAATGELSGGAAGVATGTAGLAEGSRELADGSQELATGSEELADGTSELASGSEELADGSEELAGAAGELPAVLAEVAEVADRSGQDTATTLAVLDAGDGLAREHVGAAAMRTLQLRHEGDQPVPVAVLAGTGTFVLVALLGLFGLLRRRWGRG